MSSSCVTTSWAPAARAAAVSPVPVINAGDGPGEHPTQALLDLYTIQRELGRIEGVRVAFCGDLRFGRTARSLALLLAQYPGVRSQLRGSRGGAGRLRHRRPGWRSAACRTRSPMHLGEVIGDVDVVYQTRVQKERFVDPVEFEAARSAIRIDAAVMRLLPAAAIVMHPLPRVDEIAVEVDSDPRAAYFRQAANGVAIRMALLEMLLA